MESGPYCDIPRQAQGTIGSRSDALRRSCVARFEFVNRTALSGVDRREPSGPPGFGPMSATARARFSPAPDPRKAAAMCDRLHSDPQFSALWQAPQLDIEPMAGSAFARLIKRCPCSPTNQSSPVILSGGLAGSIVAGDGAA